MNPDIYRKKDRESMALLDAVCDENGSGQIAGVGRCYTVRFWNARGLYHERVYQLIFKNADGRLQTYTLTDFVEIGK